MSSEEIILHNYKALISTLHVVPPHCQGKVVAKSRKGEPRLYSRGSQMTAWSRRRDFHPVSSFSSSPTPHHREVKICRDSMNLQ